MNKGKLLQVTAALFLVIPSIAFAQPEDFKALVDLLVGILNPLASVLGGLAILVFFWGLAEYIFAAGDKESIGAGKNKMIYGIIGLFSVAALRGIVGLIANSLGLI